MATKSFVSIRPSDIPKDIWVEIILLNPGEYRPIIIPRRGVYVVYKAKFPHLKDDRVFDMVFQKNRFDRAVKAIPPQYRQDLDRPVKFKFKKTSRSIFIKDYQMIE